MTSCVLSFGFVAVELVAIAGASCWWAFLGYTACAFLLLSPDCCVLVYASPSAPCHHNLHTHQPLADGQTPSVAPTTAAQHIHLGELTATQVNTAGLNLLAAAHVFMFICREYSGKEGPCIFPFPLLPFDHASAAAPVAAAFQSDGQALKASHDMAISSSCEEIAAAAVAHTFFVDTAPAPGCLPAPLPAPLPAQLPAQLPAPTAAPTPAAAAATVPTADITATADVVSASDKASMPEHPQISESPADICMSSDAASSQSAESMYAPRSRASSDSSGISHSSSGATANSPEIHSSSGATAKSPNSRSSSMSTRAANPRSHAQSIHKHGVKARASDRLPLATRKKQAGTVGRTAHSSKSMPTRDSAHMHAHTHVQTQEQQIPIGKSNAQLDTLSSNHPRGIPTSGPDCHRSTIITAAWHLQAPMKRNTYVQGHAGKTLKVRIKQYSSASSAALPSNGQVSWE